MDGQMEGHIHMNKMGIQMEREQIFTYISFAVIL